MADQKITALTELAEADVASTDVLPIADVSASETKKVSVKSLVEQGVDLIDDASIPAAKLASISPSSLGSSSGAKEFIAGPTGGGGAYSSRVIAATDLPAATASALGGAAAGTGLTSTSGTFSVDPATASARGAISVPSASGLSVDGSGVISHQSSVTGQTKNGFTVNASGHITAVGSIAAGDLPKATSSAVGGVFIGSGLSVTGSGQLNHTDSITAGTRSGITFNSEGHITATAALTGTDLPAGTTTAKGGVSVPSGALSVSGAGALTHDNSGVTAGTYPKVTVDARGHVTAGTTLSASDIPDISAAKLTSGTIGTSLIANDAVTGGKLANGSSVRFAGAPDTNGVVDFGTADFNGQFLYDAFNENLYLFDGNAFKSIDIVSGEIVFAGTYNANTNTVASVTAKGTAIGLTVGQPLIAPAESNLNHYLTVSVSGTGSGNAPAEALAPPDFLLSTGSSWQVLDLSTALAATAASNVSFSPTGNISSSDVQAAIQELDTEKVTASNPSFTGTASFAGNITLGTASSLVFEGSSADDYETTFAITNPTADRTITFPNVTGTIITTGDSGTVTNAMLAGSIALTKLANLTSGQLIVGNSSNVPTGVALSGDATISNSGALTIANDAVTAAKLADTSVTAGSYTAADITVDAQGRITSAASGTIGTAEIADDAVTADKLANTSVTAGSYTAADITVDAQGRVTAAASGTISTSEIANDAVTADKLADTAVTAGSYTAADITVDAQGRITSASNGSVGTGEIADAAITTAKIADDAVTAAKLANTAVTAGSYTAADITVDAQGRITSAASGTIGTSEIADDAVTAAKLADTSVTAGSYTFSSITVDAQGRITAASSGTQADTDKITEGNTEAEVVDTGSDGHFKVTTENTERIRVGPAGQIGIAGANYGTSGQVLTSGGASGAVSWADATSGGPSFTATASGAISNGDPLVVNSNGTVSKGGTTVSERSSYSAGSAFTETGVRVNHLSAVLDESQNKIVVAYQKYSDGKGFVFLATPNLSGGYSTAANTEFDAGTVSFNKIVYDSNAQKTVVFYRDSGDSDNGNARVLTVGSDNSISVGSEATFDSGNILDIDAVFDPDTNKIVVAYRDSSPSPQELKAVVGTIVNDTISFGTATTIGDGEKCGITYDTVNNKVVVAYRDQSDGKGKAAVGTVSGTSISFGTAVDFDTDSVGQCKCAFHTAEGKVAIYYENRTDNVRAHIIAGTVSGTSISFGTDVRVDDNDDQGHYDLFYHSGTERLLACRTVVNDNEAKLFGFSLSGTTLTATKNVEYRSADAISPTIVDYPDSERLHIFYNNSDTSLQANPIEVASYGTNVTTDNYCGIADADYANGATATIQTVGAVDDAQSGLTPGETYFVQDDGSLATTAGNAGSRAIAGLALSATNLLIYKA